MSYKPRYERGDWKTACDICGKLFKASSLRKRWDGFMVCPTDFENRQTQDFVRGVADIQAPQWTRPETQDNFSFTCTPITNQGVADYGGADCATADLNNPYIPLVCSLLGSQSYAGQGIAGCLTTGRIR